MTYTVNFEKMAIVDKNTGEEHRIERLVSGRWVSPSFPNQFLLLADRYFEEAYQEWLVDKAIREEIL